MFTDILEYFKIIHIFFIKQKDRDDISGFDMFFTKAKVMFFRLVFVILKNNCHVTEMLVNCMDPL